MSHYEAFSHHFVTHHRLISELLLELLFFGVVPGCTDQSSWRCFRITPISNSREVLIIHQCVSTQGRLRTSLSGAGHRLLAWMLAGLRTEELNETYVMSDFNWKWFPLCTMCAEQDFYVISISFRILINIFNCMFIIINDRVNPDLFDIVVVSLLLNLLNQISGMLSINWRFLPELQRTHFYPVYQ